MCSISSLCSQIKPRGHFLREVVWPALYRRWALAAARQLSRFPPSSSKGITNRALSRTLSRVAVAEHLLTLRVLLRARGALEATPACFLMARAACQLAELFPSAPFVAVVGGRPPPRGCLPALHRAVLLLLLVLLEGRGFTISQGTAVQGTEALPRNLRAEMPPLVNWAETAGRKAVPFRRRQPLMVPEGAVGGTAAEVAEQAFLRRDPHFRAAGEAAS